MKRMVESEIADILNEKLQVDENGIDVKDNVHVDGKISGKEIVEDMSGYTFEAMAIEGLTIDNIYVGMTKTGNKLTLVHFFKITKSSDYSGADYGNIGSFNFPRSIADKIYPNDLGGGNTLVAFGNCPLFHTNGITKIDKIYNINKYGITLFRDVITGINAMTVDVAYYGRIEQTFLLSENLVPNP